GNAGQVRQRVEVVQDSRGKLVDQTIGDLVAVEGLLGKGIDDSSGEIREVARALHRIGQRSGTRESLALPQTLPREKPDQPDWCRRPPTSSPALLSFHGSVVY